MKSIVIRMMLVLAALAAGPNALAADTGGGNVFLDAKFGALLGNNGYSGDAGSGGNSKTAWGADGGYLWKLDDARYLGLEVGYIHFGQISNGADALSFSSGQTTASAISAGIRFQYVFGDDNASFVQARGGLMSLRSDSTFSSFIPGQPTTTGSSSSSQGGLYLGLGIGHQLTQSFSLTLAYSLYNSNGSQSDQSFNTSWLGLVAEYLF